MQQPRKETSTTVQKFHTLLIDGNGLLKLAIEGDKGKFNTKGEHIGGIYQFMVQLRIFLEKRHWEFLYIFFDGDLSGKMRYDILPEYKANRGKVYGEYGLVMKDYMAKIMAKHNTEDKRNKREEFKKQRDAVMRYLPELSIRVLTDEVVESDDYISYYVNHKVPEEVITIVTGDRDLFQHLADDVFVFDLSFNKRKLISKKTFKDEYGYLQENIKVEKILTGDNSDNIKGVKGLGQDGLHKHFPEFLERKVELNEVIEKAKLLQQERIDSKKKPLKVFDNILNQVTDGSQGDKLFEINDKIIDLKKPILTERAIEEIEAYMYAPIDPEGRSIENLYKMMIKDDVYHLFSSDDRFASFLTPFKRYMNTELLRYKKSL